MAPVINFLISSGSKRKEPRCVCLSKAKTSHSHKMWNEVFSSVLHFLQVGLLLSPIVYKWLLKALFPVSRPVTTLDCILSKDKSLVFAAAFLTHLLNPAAILRCQKYLTPPFLCPSPVLLLCDNSWYS